MQSVEEFLCRAHLSEEEKAKIPPIDQDAVAIRCMAEWKVPRNRLEGQKWKQEHAAMSQVPEPPKPASEIIVVKQAVEEPLQTFVEDEARTGLSELGAVFEMAPARNRDTRNWIERPIFPGEAMPQTQTLFIFG
jgi:hypothetical protein